MNLYNHAGLSLVQKKSLQQRCLRVVQHRGLRGLVAQRPGLALSVQVRIIYAFSPAVNEKASQQPADGGRI